MKYTKPLYRVLAQHVAWDPPRGQFTAQREAEIKRCLDMLPSGSGWDLGTRLDHSRSTGEFLVLFGEYHHMDEHGSYSGWTHHTIIVRPSLSMGFTLKITGPNHRDIKDYLHEMFDVALREEIEVYAPKGEEEAS